MFPYDFIVLVPTPDLNFNSLLCNFRPFFTLFPYETHDSERHTFDVCRTLTVVDADDDFSLLTFAVGLLC